MDPADRTPPSRKSGPVLIDLDDETPTPPSPAEAPPVPDTPLAMPEGTAPDGRAMAGVATLAGRGKGSRLARWFWGLALALVGAVISVTAWNALWALIAAQPLLGYALGALVAAFVGVAGLIAIKEVSVFARLSRIDQLNRDAATALADSSLAQARAVVGGLDKLYAGRSDLAWGRARLKEREADMFDAEALLAVAETDLMAPLDRAAEAEVAAAARQVATVTALVPLALADVVAALSANIRMIRRIGEIYGGRSGTLGSWRLLRAVVTHLVTTGAMAVGDDFLEPMLGGSLLGKLSRRFGEGLVNGALTVRVGVAAMEVCRPLPFSDTTQPSTRAIGRHALGGLFSASK